MTSPKIRLTENGNLKSSQELRVKDAEGLEIGRLAQESINAFHKDGGRGHSCDFLLIVNKVSFITASLS